MTLTQDEHNDLLRLLAIAETCMLAHAYPVAWGGQIDMARKVIRGAVIIEKPLSPEERSKQRLVEDLKKDSHLPTRHPKHNPIAAAAVLSAMLAATYLPSPVTTCWHCGGVHPVGCCAQDGHGG